MRFRRANLWTALLLAVGLLLQLGLYLCSTGASDRFDLSSLPVLAPSIAVAAIWAWFHVWLKHLPEEVGASSVREHLRCTQVLIAAGIAAMPIQSLLAKFSVPTPSSPVLGLVVVGTIFAVLGNRVSKLRKNASVGIRNTWTLADDEVWLHTHRLLGRTTVLAASAFIVMALLMPNSAWIHAPIALFAAGILSARVYSFWKYSRLHPVTG